MAEPTENAQQTDSVAGGSASVERSLVPRDLLDWIVFLCIAGLLALLTMAGACDSNDARGILDGGTPNDAGPVQEGGVGEGGPNDGGTNEGGPSDGGSDKFTCDSGSNLIGSGIIVGSFGSAGLKELEKGAFEPTCAQTRTVADTSGAPSGATTVPATTPAGGSIGDYLAGYFDFAGTIMPTDPMIWTQFGVVLRDTANAGNAYTPSPSYPNDTWQGGTMIYALSLEGAGNWKLVKFVANGSQLTQEPTDVVAVIYDNSLRIFIPKSELTALSYGLRLTAFQHFDGAWLNSPPQHLLMAYVPPTEWHVVEILKKTPAEVPDFFTVDPNN